MALDIKVQMFRPRKLLFPQINRPVLVTIIETITSALYIKPITLDWR